MDKDKDGENQTNKLIVLRSDILKAKVNKDRAIDYIIKKIIFKTD
jgi:hypothetical protein